MNKLIILGNGFDLAHNLPTSYSHFINWIFKVELKEFIKKFEAYTSNSQLIIESSYFKLFSFKIESSNWLNKEEINVNLLSNLKNIKSDYCASTLSHETFYPSFKFRLIYSNSIIERCVKNINLTNWVDIERIYYEVLVKIIKREASETIDELNSDLDEVKALLLKYLELIKESDEIDVDDFFLKRMTLFLKK